MTLCFESTLKFRKFDFAHDADVLAISFAFFRLVITTVSIIDLIGTISVGKK